MAEKKVGTNEVIYNAGDVPDVAYIIISGKVELVSTTQGREEQIRIIGPEKTFGEYALFDPQSLRPFTARALEPTVLHTVSLPEFEKLVSECPKDIQPFMAMAFEKMKLTKLKDNKAFIAAVLETDISKLVIEPASDALKSQFKPIEVTVARLPFRIGGYPEGGEVSRRDSVHLAIASQPNPLRVSRQHCEIRIEEKEIVVTDLGSRFCTEVNDVIIGRGHGDFSAPLKKGTNKMTLGASGGPYKLTVKCV